MIYYLALLLKSEVGAFRVLTYNTVRAGGAAFTAFLIALVLGPPLIRRLRALKIGQYIRKEYVEDLHALHQGKAGTPTMGGALIVLSTLFASLLWGQLANRLLWVALGVFCLLGAVGSLDDYTKLRRKHNKGLSAKTKFAGQIVVGLALGLYLVLNPITESATTLSHLDVQDWPGLIQALQAAIPAHSPQSAGSSQEPTAQARVCAALAPEIRTELQQASPDQLVSQAFRYRLLGALNTTLTRRDLYDADLWRGTGLNGEASKLLETGLQNLSDRELVRFNRILL